MRRGCAVQERTTQSKRRCWDKYLQEKWSKKNRTVEFSSSFYDYDNREFCRKESLFVLRTTIDCVLVFSVRSSGEAEGNTTCRLHFAKTKEHSLDEGTLSLKRRRRRDCRESGEVSAEHHSRRYFPAPTSGFLLYFVCVICDKPGPDIFPPTKGSGSLLVWGLTVG